MAELNPEVLRWAVARSGLTDEQIRKAFPKYPQWLDGTWQPTVKQLLDFADRCHVSVSDLFARELPDYALQIADFRTVDDRPASEPSPELFDVVDAMLARQDWMRDYFIHEGYPAVDFVGSFREVRKDVHTVLELARKMHTFLGLDDDWAYECEGAPQALRKLKDSIEAQGISVVINGIVGDNTHRTLNVAEFRGFVLADAIAPLIFINGRDSKSAQLFTLIHELCHLAYAQTGVSNSPEDEDSNIEMERFCNSVAAEFLVPACSLVPWWTGHSGSAFKKIETFSHASKASFVVVARKARDEKLISNEEYFHLWNAYKETLAEKGSAGKTGGNYYLSKRYRLGNVFSDAVYVAVHSSYLSYRDAYELTGMSAPAFAEYFEEAI